MIGLSILIPVYEYNPTELIKDLIQQGIDIKIPLEIIIIDDASTVELFSTWATPFKDSTTIHITRLDQNIGRAAIRNKLIQQATFDALLFLDADTIPCTKNYLASFTPFLSSNYSCVCGGTAYRKEQPEAWKRLRWEYGKAREEISSTIRNQNPFGNFTLNNLLIRKEVALKFPLDNAIQKYGHEDTLLGMTLAANHLQMLHIDNFVYHEGLDTNDVFLIKVKQSVSTLVELYTQGKLLSDTKLIRLHKKLLELKINRFIALLIKPFIRSIEKNLQSAAPSMVYMDVLKYWYFEECLHKKNN
ncbi:glycosyltransferase [uncultured Cytophaga sp.]|uniref:glycosyltransferase family 2 protein n=1 Tax=uncultured Cytophaga sp. TaxID=160238 RepID=UPI00262CFB04|nr:glycosyltransferase [uncultured Cytophaga sp.]